MVAADPKFGVLIAHGMDDLAQRWRFTIEPMASMRSGLVVSIEIVHN
jgi:hypothetical protein